MSRGRKSDQDRPWLLRESSAHLIFNPDLEIQTPQQIPAPSSSTPQESSPLTLPDIPGSSQRQPPLVIVVSIPPEDDIPLPLGLLESSPPDPEPDPSVSSTDELSPWETIPPLVFAKLLEYRYAHFHLRALRYVCSSWKRLLDSEYGLHVSITPSSIGFCRNVTMRGARLLTEPPPDIFGNDPSLLTTIIISRSVSISWLRQVLPFLPSLINLTLRGVFLSRRKLFVSTPLHEDDGGVIAPASELEPLTFPHLISLKIIMHEETFPRRGWYRVNSRSFRRATIAIANISANLCLLLPIIDCPSLKSFQLYFKDNADEDPIPELSENNNWRLHPLQKFLGRHASTIESFYLPQFDGPRALHQFPAPEPPADDQLPKNLKRIGISTMNYFMEDEDDQVRVQDWSYFALLFQNQRSLEELQLEMSEFPLGWIRPMLTSLCSNSFATLRFIDIELDVDRFDNVQLQDIFNLGIFRNCHSLQYLRFDWDVASGPDLELHGFSSLPSSLKRLVLLRFNIQAPRSGVEVRKFQNLEELRLDSFIIEGGVPGGSHPLVLEILREILSIRTLNGLYVQFDEMIEGAEGDEELREILEMTMNSSPGNLTLHNNDDVTDVWSWSLFFGEGMGASDADDFYPDDDEEEDLDDTDDNITLAPSHGVEDYEYVDAEDGEDDDDDNSTVLILRDGEGQGRPPSRRRRRNDDDPDDIDEEDETVIDDDDDDDWYLDDNDVEDNTQNDDGY